MPYNFFNTYCIGLHYNPTAHDVFYPMVSTHSPMLWTTRASTACLVSMVSLASHSQSATTMVAYCTALARLFLSRLCLAMVRMSLWDSVEKSVPISCSTGVLVDKSTMRTDWR